jgi:hypothetical protein
MNDILDTVEDHDSIHIFDDMVWIDDSVRRSIEQSARPDHQRIKAQCDSAATWCLPAVATPACSATAVSVAVASAEARLARLGLVYLDVPAFEFGIIELVDCVGNFFRICHFDKAEAFRLSGELIRDDRGTLHLTNL